jgi:site-specific DNA-cytosine methylase
MNGLSLFANVGIAETYLHKVGVDIVVANELLEERAKFYRHLYPIKEKVADLRSVLIDVEMMRDGCADPELKEKLRKLSETIKYSDPMSNEAIEGVEQRIQRKVSELRVYLDDNQIADATQACKELEMLYIERNKKLAMSK